MQFSPFLGCMKCQFILLVGVEARGGGIYREEGNANTSVFKKKIHVHISTMYMYLHLKYYTFNCIYYVLH